MSPDTSIPTPEQAEALGKLASFDFKSGDYPAAGKRFDLGGIPHIVVPTNCELLEYEKALPAPVRIRTHLQVRQLASFIDYVKQYALPGTRIFANNDGSGLSATAIIDYPETADKTGWGQHRCTFKTQHSTEWHRWIDSNKKGLSQIEFAEFVENNLAHFIRPSGADMLTMAREIELKQSVEWKGAVRLENGDTALNYTNTTKTGGAGDIEFPQGFTIGIRPFRGGEPYKIEARLRPRLDEGKLTVRYELLKIEELLESAMQDIVAEITTKTAITPLIGDAPASV